MTAPIPWFLKLGPARFTRPGALVTPHQDSRERASITDMRRIATSANAYVAGANWGGHCCSKRRGRKVGEPFASTMARTVPLCPSQRTGVP
jgi:hypothetical protein